MAKSRWIKGAIRHPGAFTRKARSAGMSTQAYARKVASDPRASTKTKRQAALARTLGRMNKRKGRSSSPKEPLAVLTMADAIDVANLPPGLDAYAGYVDGQWPTYPHLPPAPHHLAIATGTDPTKWVAKPDCADIETGDWTIPAAPGALAADMWALYISVSRVTTLLTVVPRSSFRLWTAHDTRVPHLCSPACDPPTGAWHMPTTADATQWGFFGGYDQSLVSTAFFGGIVPPPPPITIGDTVKVVAVPLFTTDANGWFATDVTLPTGVTKDAIVSVECDAGSPFDGPGLDWHFCSGEPDYLPNQAGKARVVFHGTPVHQFTARVYVAV